MFWRTKKWWWLAAGYLLTGLFAVAIPLKLLVPATNLLGVLLLTVFWPLWCGQTLFGYNVLDWFPESFWAYFFDF